MSELVAGIILGSLITLLTILLAIAAVVYIPRVRAQVFRMLVKSDLDCLVVEVII